MEKREFFPVQDQEKRGVNQKETEQLYKENQEFIIFLDDLKTHKRKLNKVNKTKTHREQAINCLCQVLKTKIPQPQKDYFINICAGKKLNQKLFATLKENEEFREKYSDIRERYDETDPGVDHKCQTSIRQFSFIITVPADLTRPGQPE